MTPITYTFSPWNYTEFSRVGGHMLIYVHVFSSEREPSKIQFVFDSGAYITVLTRLSARKIGLPLTGAYTANLTGFNKERGSDKAEIVVVPRIEIGKHIVEDTQILVPLEDIEIAEVIGEDLLECFYYVVDHGIDRIYFAKNPIVSDTLILRKTVDWSTLNYGISVPVANWELFSEMYSDGTIAEYIMRIKKPDCYNTGEFSNSKNKLLHHRANFLLFYSSTTDILSRCLARYAKRGGLGGSQLQKAMENTD